MAAPMLDTLKLARRLAAAGMPAEQADGVAEAIAEGFGEQLATKADIAELRAEIEGLRVATKADIAELRAGTQADIAELRAGTKADIAELRAEIVALGGNLRNEIAALRTATVQWIVGAVLLNAAMLAGFGIAIWNLPRK
jgi:chromosome segregation ATPase